LLPTLLLGDADRPADGLEGGTTCAGDAGER
jgi:hypothetical protein